MRAAFLNSMLEIAARDPRVWLVTGDLGFSVLEPFAARFPERYLNAGVSEQNMTGVAAGLAMSGKIVFTYSIANFPLLRCLEQVRNDVCYHNLNVKIVNVGGGLAYGSAGYSHHAVEDLGIARLLPNMTVFAPGDPLEATACTEAAAITPGPVFLRLGKGKEPKIHHGVPDLRVGHPLKVRDGLDLVILSTGGTLGLAVDTATGLTGKGISAAVFSVPTLKPIAWESLLPLLRETASVLTIEEHAIGGLGSVVAEKLCTLPENIRMSSLYLHKQQMHVAGSQDYLREQGGLTVAEAMSAAESLLADRKAISPSGSPAR